MTQPLWLGMGQTSRWPHCIGSPLGACPNEETAGLPWTGRSRHSVSGSAGPLAPGPVWFPRLGMATCPREGRASRPPCPVSAKWPALCQCCLPPALLTFPQNPRTLKGPGHVTDEQAPSCGQRGFSTTRIDRLGIAGRQAPEALVPPQTPEGAKPPSCCPMFGTLRRPGKILHRFQLMSGPPPRLYDAL